MPDLDPEEEVRRLAAALRNAIRLSGVSARQIEREIGLSTGYLTRILAGQVQLRMAHVLAICRIIGVPAGSFFAALYPPRPPASEAEARMIRGPGATAFQAGPGARPGEPAARARCVPRRPQGRASGTGVGVSPEDVDNPVSSSVYYVSNASAQEEHS